MVSQSYYLNPTYIYFILRNMWFESIEENPYHIWTERSIKSSHAGVKPVYRVVVRLKPPAPLPFCRIPLSLLSPLDPSTIRHADTGTGYANPAGTGTLCGGPSLTFLLCLLWITSCLDIWSKFGMSMVWKSVIVPTKEMKGRLLLQIPDSMYSNTFPAPPKNNSNI